MKTKRVRNLFTMSMVLLGLGLLSNTAWADWETVIPSSSLTPGNFGTYWNWFYPWGDTHNGSAKMYVNQVTLDSSGAATIVAVTPDPDSSWKYRSGAFHSKALITVDSQYPEWDMKGEFKAPVVRGSWPAFWPTGADSWPPEIDILEFKGDNYNWFNTYDGGWETKTVWIADAATAWHEYRCHVTRINDRDVKVDFYLDGSWVATHTGSNFTGKRFNLIVNMQMEGSSGSPGPTSPTYYYARNIVVARNNVLSSGPVVTVSATDASAAEPGPDPGTFTFTRTGSTASSMAVRYTVGGTATSSSDYTPIGTSVTIPAGQASTSVTVMPVDDTVMEGPETVTVTLQADAAYAVGSPASATVTIAANDGAIPNLVHWWELDGNGNDSVGSLNGQNTGTPSWAAGVFGQALQSSATHSMTFGVDGVVLAGSSDFTVSLWMASPDVTAERSIWSKHGGDWDYGYPMIALSLDADGRLNLWGRKDAAWNYGQILSSYIGYDDNAWHLVTVTRQSGVTRLYVDGVLDKTDNGSEFNYAVNPAYTLRIAEASYAGLLDDVLLYDRALSASEVQALYAQPANTPPVFTSDPINLPAAYEDAPFSGSIAGNATDADGDPLTYSKVAGPVWLSVSSSGALSGTPGNANVGLNGFTVQVSDDRGGTDQATLNITVLNVNDPPYWSADPITTANATETHAYTGQTLSGRAGDVDVGDTLTYSKVSGPAWLSVAANGALGGTPGSADVGVNSFKVRVTDQASASVDATLNITVKALPQVLHVQSIVLGTKSAGGSNLKGVATVKIVNANGVAASGATVSGTFSGSYRESKSAITDANGVAVITTGGKAKKPAFQFTVTGVTRGSDIYDPSANLETSDTYP